MFSEYASRFLAQSQSRFSTFGQADTDHAPQSTDWFSSRPGRPHRDTGRASRSLASRGYTGYQQHGNGSRFGNIGFASRISAAQDAPLFHGTLDEFREDDEEEREREAADMFALQRSRRVAAASQLLESTESANSHVSLEASAGQIDSPYTVHGPGPSVKSSRSDARSSHRHHPRQNTLFQHAEQSSHSGRDVGSPMSKGNMVDVGLDSYLEGNDDPPESLLGEDALSDASPPPFQRLRPQSERTPFMLKGNSSQGRPSHSAQLPHTTHSEHTTPQESAQPSNTIVEGELFRHDPFFAWIYMISFAAMMSTFVLVWLHTAPRKSPVGDTIYSTVQKSFDMLAVDTIVSVFVSLIWLAALRSFVRPLVSVILVAVPVIMLSFSLYAFISSFKGSTHGSSFQDSIMRWASFLPAAACIVWLWLVVKGRRAIQQAIDILQFSSKILAQNPALLVVGFCCLGLIIVWTWAWLVMFTRVFMGGYFSKSLIRFVIQLSSWWLGAAFVLMYLWTLAIINAVHRATTAATVSQWYFHRNAGPVTPSKDIVLAALGHATSTVFGSICQSTLLALMIRAPLLFLPRRLGIGITNMAAFWMPTPIMALTSPLTVTYSAIHSQNLATSARGLDQMEVISPTIPTTTLTPRALRSRGQYHGLIPYRLAKLLLVATRFIMATGLGFAGWVITAKQLRIQLPDGMGVRGSAYAYVVGLMASFIGYSVMGAVEGILSGIVDAVLVCYGSERRIERGHGRFCLEAAYLFGERRVESDGYA
ncbi:hypothetical protein CDD81_5135 [Ophiocordyceps australis]|uniref:Protein PNS1 n=1 Tax=Ophiocordyceps australis TaxID=1399860 RepID=A0A2C5Y9A9_9HYPO|nr:hypothetical protein CDD81_5135 [Ophiocordyceps australis]